MSHVVPQQLQHAYPPLAVDDLAPLLALAADDIRWHVDDGPLAGSYVAKPAVLDVFGRVLTLYEAGSFTQETRAVVADDQHAVVLSAEGGRRGTDAVACSAMYAWNLRGGRGVRIDLDTDDVYCAFRAVRGHGSPTMTAVDRAPTRASLRGGRTTRPPSPPTRSVTSCSTRC